MSEKTGDTQLAFYFVDVFSDKPLTGNPITLVPDAERVEESKMQAIAREFNQSETTFLLPPTRSGADCQLRSFTPAGKKAFGAGHNALGAWWWLAESGRLHLEVPGGRFAQQIGERYMTICRNWVPRSVSGGNAQISGRCVVSAHGVLHL